MYFATINIILINITKRLYQIIAHVLGNQLPTERSTDRLPE